MPVLTKVGSITGGLYTNPNTFTRNLSLAYDALGLQINTITEILGQTQRSPVSEILDNRWTYPVSPSNHGTTINPATSGLDGTAIFTYAGSDYGLIDPTFLIENPDNISLKRPATIYEAFLKLKLYTDKAIAERSAAIISMVTGSEINLTGAEEGALLQNLGGEVSASTWRFMTDGGDFILRAPGGNYFVSNANQIKLQAPEVKFITNFLTLTDVEDIPSGAQAGVGRIYYSEADSSLHLVDHTGIDTALGSVSIGFPIINADLHDGGIQQAEVLKFSSTYQSVITNTAPAINVNAPRIIVQGQRATGTGEGGDVYLWGGDAETNGGDIDISAGDADYTSGGNGGYVNIQGGTGFDSGGDVTIRGGTSTDNAGGNVAIYGGTGDIPGQVTIATESYTWTFSSDGNTTIPNLKDIKDVAGNTVISGGNRVKNYNSSAGASVPVDESNIYAITTTTAATTVTLPLGASTAIGYEFIVFDKTGSAATKNITVTAQSGDSIISAPSGIAIDTNYGLLAFKYVGNNSWLILYGR